MRQLISRCFPLSLGGTHLQETLISSTRASESKSCNLFLQSGLIASSCAGMFHFMPPMLRSINKLETLIDRHMDYIGGQKVQLSSLGPKSLWDKTGRWAQFGDELLKTSVSGTDYCLSPTHEEAICSVVSQYLKQLSHTHLPIRLYQTTSKYRGEAKPHSGLLRCREFIMNDLYTFDPDKTSAISTYDKVLEMYKNIFNELDVNVIRANAGTGVIGGDISHEYHVRSDIGEDKVGICERTGLAWNLGNTRIDEIPVDPDHINEVSCIEVGHTFLLGNCYSRKLQTNFIDMKQKSVPCEMGCYGLGVSRIVAACVESMSMSTGMRWPFVIAPYKVCIIPPKLGSNEANVIDDNLVGNLYDSLQKIQWFAGDVIIDDRTHRTIGWRRKHANLIGYPIVIVIGKKLTDPDPKLEIIFQRKKDFTKYVNISDCVESLLEALK